MINDLFLLLGFFGTIGISGFAVWRIMNTEKYAPTMQQIVFSFFGLLLVYGLFFLSYMFSFAEETTIEYSQTISISNNQYIFLNWIFYFSSLIFFIGVMVHFIEYAIYVSKQWSISEARE